MYDWIREKNCVNKYLDLSSSSFDYTFNSEHYNKAPEIIYVKKEFERILNLLKENPEIVKEFSSIIEESEMDFKNIKSSYLFIAYIINF